MRAHYGSPVAAWKEEEVSHHGYRHFGAVFGSAIPWEDKRRFLPGDRV